MDLLGTNQPLKGLTAYEKSLSLDLSMAAYLNAVSIACEVGNFESVKDLIFLIRRSTLT